MNPALIVGRAGLSPDARSTVEDYEQRFGTRFSHLVQFDSQTLKYLHGPGTLPDNVRVASAGSSAGSSAVVDRMSVVTSVANLTEQGEADRGGYLQALLDIYGMLPVQATEGASVPGSTVLAPEREGRILADLLGVTPHRDGWAPQAKRMPVGGGLLVGVGDALPSRAERLVVVDGVVASGVTLMAMMQLTLRAGAEIEVFTCHATPEGALALARYAELLEVRLTLHVGHVSGMLNEKFYTVEPDDRSVLLLGDIGDTITPVAPTTPPGGPA